MAMPSALSASAISRLDYPEREPRDLSPAERKIKNWIKQNHGVLSRIAREFDCSVTFVQRIAYNREAKSAGMKIERKLLALGCPLIQFQKK